MPFLSRGVENDVKSMRREQTSGPTLSLEFEYRGAEEKEGKKARREKEKAMSVRPEQCGILVVSQRSEKPHEHTLAHTLAHTRTRTQIYKAIFSSCILSPLWRVCCAPCSTHTHAHTCTRTQRKHSLIPW